MKTPPKIPTSASMLVAMIIAGIALALATSPTVRAADGNPAGAAQQAGSVSGRVKNAVTGQYLNRARVTVKDTEQVTYTDDFGAYRLVGVPSGPIVLDVFYTDLDPQEIPLNIAGGRETEQNVDLTSKSRYAQDGMVITLDPFLVASNRETDAQAIATNEQRFAPNLINVLATDAMGDLLGNDPGEFLKFLPGLTRSTRKATSAAFPSAE